MYRNHEHYPDPTAGRALGSLRRKENQLNTGKQFEADWKSSMPKDAWCYRLKDSAATYYGGNENLSFSIDNICDFDVYRYPMHHYFELKTIETPSIPLEKIKGQTAHVVINYRGKVNRTFAVPASAVLEYMQTQTRKSIPWQWAALNGIEVEQHLLRVHWRYDVEGLLRVLEGGSTE